MFFYFYGVALLQRSQFKTALKILEKGLEYNVSSPYREKLQNAMSKAKQSMKGVVGDG